MSKTYIAIGRTSGVYHTGGEYFDDAKRAFACQVVDPVEFVIEIDEDGSVRRVDKPKPTYMVTWGYERVFAANPTHAVGALADFDSVQEMANVRILRSCDTGYEYISEDELREAAK